MDTGWFGFFALAVLFLHLLWIVWVVFGALFTRGHVALSAFHMSALIYGIVIELGPWPCPLTLAEQQLMIRTGTGAYHGSFLVHYLDAIVYPDVPQSLVTVAGVAVCAFNIGIYVRRFWWNRRPAISRRSAGARDAS